ncbi:hypothetical protein, partial, partial [Absidia glauca]
MKPDECIKMAKTNISIGTTILKVNYMEMMKVVSAVLFDMSFLLRATMRSYFRSQTSSIHVSDIVPQRYVRQPSLHQVAHPPEELKKTLKDMMIRTVPSQRRLLDSFTNNHMLSLFSSYFGRKSRARQNNIPSAPSTPSTFGSQSSLGMSLLAVDPSTGYIMPGDEWNGVD